VGTIVERVARAIAFYCPEGWSPELHKEMARAAIAAMREPTPEMICAGAYGSGEDSEQVAIGCWEAMIDAALGEKDELGSRD